MNRAVGMTLTGVSIVILVATAQVHAAGTPSAQGSAISFQLSAQAPSTNTAARLGIVYRNPTDAGAKPPAIRHLRIDLPAGIELRLQQTPSCASSDGEIMAGGPAACPSSSQVGSGTLVAITGFGPPIDPFTTDVTIFNTGEGFLEVVQDRSTGAVLAVDRIRAEGDSLIGNPPTIPGGPPDGNSAVRTIDFEFPAETGYVVTPPDCPAEGWQTHASFDFADGSTQAASGVTPCSQARGTGAARCVRTVPGSPRGETLRGSGRADRIRGRGGADRIAGGGGDDCLFGGPGRDRIDGGGGDDRIKGGRGSDRIRGGPGADVIRTRGGGRDRIDCGRGRDIVHAGPRDRVVHCELSRG